MSEIYNRIKQRRLELGLTVEELANRMGYKDKSSISKIENGKADIPQSKVAAFARALDTTTAYLVGAEEDAKPASEITFDDFTYALHNELDALTDENKAKLLEMAKFFKQQQDLQGEQ